MRPLLEDITKTHKILFIFDELENLLNKDKREFELLLDLFSINMEGFVKICISNTLDLFSGVQSKNKRQMDFQYLPFKPYKPDQIQRIL